MTLEPGWPAHYAAVAAEAEADAQDLNGIASSGSDWYLLDRGRLRILQLDPGGRATRAIDLESLGTYGPNGLAVDSTGNIYLADTGSNRILVFASSGALIYCAIDPMVQPATMARANRLLLRKPYAGIV